MIVLSYTFDGKKYQISREAVVAAMRRFDEEFGRGSLGIRVNRRGAKYFVWWRGKSYPPKDILRRLPQWSASRFSGGDATNQVFRDLEFYVGKGKYPRRVHDSTTPLLSLSTLKKKLMAQRWARFTRNFLKGQDGQYPGVYLFAWSNQKLQGKQIKFDDIFYVGSSCTALRMRLNQFYDGIERNCCHSAAMRFYTRWSHRALPGQSFFVATVGIPCETRKELRTEKDIHKMGRVAELEYAMLAEVKKHTGFEPLLNRK